MAHQKVLTLQDWLNKANKSCSANNPTAPIQIAGKIFKLSKTRLLQIAPEKKLTRTQLARLNNLLGRLLAGRPISQVTKQTSFHNLQLQINSNVLSPRAETEELVNYAIKNIPQNSKVFDIGCGSGAIGLSLSKARADLKVTLSDISPKALSLTRINLRKNGLKKSNLEIRRSSLIKKFDQKDLEDSFFLANLPYVSKNWSKLNQKQLQHEPKISLFAKQNGLQTIYSLIDSLYSRNLLNSQNWLLIEHDPKQLQNLELFCTKLSLKLERISDYVSKISKD